MYDRTMEYTPVRGEDIDVLEENEFDTPNRNSTTKNARVAGATIVLLVVAALAGTAVVPGGTMSSAESLLSEDNEVFVVSNEYERARGFPLNDGIYEHMVQVHKSTRLELASGRSAVFLVEDSPDSGTFTQINEEALTSVEYLFEDHGAFAVKVLVEDAEGGSSTTHDFKVNAKIIRYEIRDLSEADRQAYFDALQKFYSVGQTEGETLFGAEYKSLSYLVREHLYGAADKECDHWHDDAGILTHHVGITWEMETSMRMINPATAAHYWDYTREQTLGIEWYDSPIFGDDWFGSNSPKSPDHIVDKGRFAYTPVVSAVGFSETMNPYGLLRSPWNTNPAPFLLRSSKTFFGFADGNANFPSCSQFAKYLDSSLGEVLYALNGELHGPVHVMIGGHWNNNAKWESVGSGMDYSDKFLLLSKWLWRQGFVRTPSSCSSDVPGKECMPVCPDEITGGVDDSTKAFDLLKKTGVFDLNPAGHLLEQTMTAAGLDWLDLWKELCHVGWPGDMFTSAAPQDPTFWPLHGNAERYVMYLRVMKKAGAVSFDESWGYVHPDVVPSDTGMVCDWSGVTTEVGMPTCVHDTCTGHREDDLLPFTNLYPKQGDSLISNAQMYSIIDPYRGNIPYAYDSLSYWEGCSDNNLLSEFNSISATKLAADVHVPSWKDFVAPK